MNVKTEIEDKKLTVGLLLGDILVAKKISRVFRKIGIVPYVYETLAEVTAETNYPSLLIADVTLMSDGSSALLDIDEVAQEKLPLAFYYEESTKPLLVSTYNLFHLGLISGEGSLEGQLKGVLKRLNHFFRLEADSQRLEYVDDQHKREVRSLYQRNEEFKQFHFYNEELGRMIRLIEAQKGQGDFYLACEKVFENESMVESFTFFELSLTGQKLITPTTASKKFHKIPSLWLKDACTRGIDPYAQNLASQVSVELMGDNIVSLYLKSQFSQPSALFFIKVADSDFLSLFDWDLFETYLNGLYSYFDMKKQQGAKNLTKLTTLWDMFSVLDNQIYTSMSGRTLVEDEEWKIVQLSFQKLLGNIAHNQGIRFYWDSFYADFVKLLFEKTQFDFSIAPSGIVDLTFLVQEADKDEFYSVLSEHAKTFSYWRYFDDADMVLNQDFTPYILTLPNSTKALSDYLADSKSSPYAETNNPRLESASAKRAALLDESRVVGLVEQ